VQALAQRVARLLGEEGQAVEGAFNRRHGIP
jgi:hypothetical protein